MVGLSPELRSWHYSLVICQLTRRVVYGSAMPRRRWRYNWSFWLVSAGGSFSDIMIPYLLAIWVFPGLFVAYWLGYIGRDFVRMFDHILPGVFGQEVPLSSSSVNGTCFGGPQLGPGGYGYPRHVSDHGEG